MTFTRLRTLSAVVFLLTAFPLHVRAEADPAPEPDADFRQGYRLLADEKHREARERFSRISPEGHDLGDYVLYFTGASFAREGLRDEAASALASLVASFPDSPLVPLLSHELAFAAVKADDLPRARKHFAVSRGKVTGNGRKAEEGYVAARLLERENPSPEAPAASPSPPSGEEASPPAGQPPSGEEAGGPGAVPPPTGVETAAPPTAQPPPAAKAGPSPAPQPSTGEDADEPAPAEDPSPEEPEVSESPSSAARFLPTAEAARAHLENFAAYGVQAGAARSMERLWMWRANGKIEGLSLGAAFSRRFAGALFRAGEAARARALYEEALSARPEGDEYYTTLLEYAEFLRKVGDTSKARSLLSGAVEGAPDTFRAEVGFLFARVDWKAGRTAEARRRFREIADRGVPPQTAERARYQLAWMAEDEGDLPLATEEFGKLVQARDEPTRQESTFRQAFGLYRQKRYPEAAAAFEAGEKSGFSTVERARHAYWRGRMLQETGEEERGVAVLRGISSDPSAGPFALLAAGRLGADPFAMLSAPSSGETRRCDQEREELWERVRGADWSASDAVKVRRASRLTRLGMTEFAVLEAERVDRGEVRRVLGLAGGQTPALFRYLAGDLRGAILETVGLATGSGPPGLIDRLQFPLAPQFLEDCDRKRHGVDPLVLHSIIRQESHFQFNALSSAGAVGLMQLMPQTARMVARDLRPPRKVRRQDLLRPELNVDLGAAYLSRLLKGYKGDYLRAVAAYNAGESAVDRWWKGAQGDPALFFERVSYRETRGYLRKVFFNLLQYYRIYRPEMFARYVPTAPPEATPAPGASGTPPGEGTPDAPPAPAPSPAPEATGDAPPVE